MDTQSIAQALADRTYQPKPGKPLKSQDKTLSAKEAMEELEYLSRDTTWGKLVCLYGPRPAREAFKVSWLEPAISWRDYLELEAERLEDLSPRFRWKGDEVALYAEDTRDTPSRLARVARLAEIASGEGEASTGPRVPPPDSAASRMDEDGV